MNSLVRNKAVELTPMVSKEIPQPMDAGLEILPMWGTFLRAEVTYTLQHLGFILSYYKTGTFTVRTLFFLISE